MLCTFPQCGRIRRSSALWCPGHRAQVRRGATLAPIHVSGQPCQFDGCIKARTNRGLCAAHAKQAREGKDLQPLRRTIRCNGCPHPRGATCDFNPCGFSAISHGLCPGHARQRNRGQTLRALEFRTERGARTPQEQNRQYAHARRARMVGTDACEVSTRDWRRLVQRYGGLCAYCRIRPWTDQDHVIPLVRGGRHAIGNVLPACGRCNRSKGARLLVEWKHAG